MRKSLLKKLCCPIDKSDLQYQVFKEDEQGDIVEGVLTCATCRRYYPIVYGLPIMTPDEYREKSLEAPILSRWGLTSDQARSKAFLLEGENKSLDREADS